MIKYIWAAPASAFGLVFVLLALRRGHVAIVGGVVECTGPWVAAVLQRMPPGEVAAIALGHVVAACNGDVLEWTRSHERVHVAQAERWGPFFVPAYLLASVVAFAAGGHFYWDNVFEREARLGERG